MRGEISYYELLSVSPRADEAIIRAAYLVLAKRYHPDLAIGSKTQSTEKFQLFTTAYETLCDANRRAQYDEQRNQREIDKYRSGRSAGNSYKRRDRPTDRQSDVHSTKAPSKARTVIGVLAGGVAAVAVMIGIDAASGYSLDAPTSAAEPVQDVRMDTPRPMSIAARLPPAQETPSQVIPVAAPPRQEGRYETAEAVAAEARWRADNEQREHERQEQAQAAWAKEVKRLFRVQADRAKAEEARVASRAGGAAPSTPRPVEGNLMPAVLNAAASSVAHRKSNCTGDGGIKFSIENLNGVAIVSYNGASPVRARMDDQGQFIVLSEIAPNNQTTISLMKGATAATTVISWDASGSPTRFMKAKCRGLAY